MACRPRPPSDFSKKIVEKTCFASNKWLLRHNWCLDRCQTALAMKLQPLSPFFVLYVFIKSLWLSPYGLQREATIGFCILTYRKKCFLRPTNSPCVTTGIMIGVKVTDNVDTAYSSNCCSSYVYLNPMVKPLWLADRGHPQIFQKKLLKKHVLRPTNGRCVTIGARIGVKQPSLCSYNLYLHLLFFMCL
jgi:hypothetical protein